MADSSVAVTAGTGTSIDTRTESTNGNHRQVVVLGDPATNAGVAPVDATSGLKVDLGADNDVTVSGTVTANLSATDNAVLDDIAADTETIKTAVELLDNTVAGTELQVDIVSSALPSGAATAAKQPALGTAGTPSTDVLTVQGHASMTALKVDGSATTQPVSGTVTANLSATDNTVLDNIDADTSAIQTAVELIDDAVYTDGSGTPSKAIAIAGTDGTNPQIVKTDTSGELQVDVLSMPTVTVTATNLDVQSGGADLATSAQGSAIQTAVETIDNAISGNEMQVDVVGALPTGTNAIGKLNPPDVDVTAHTNYARKYYTSAGAATDGIIWSPAAGKRWHVVGLYINVSAAATVTLEDDKAAGDDPVFKSEFAANSGVFLSFPEKYPMASGEDAADLLITTSAGNVYVTVVGYEI